MLARTDPVQFRLTMLGASRTISYRDYGGPAYDAGRMRWVIELAAHVVENSRTRDGVRVDRGRRLRHGRELERRRGAGAGWHFRRHRVGVVRRRRRCW